MPTFVRSFLRNLGLACMAVSVLCLGGSSVRADPNVFARVGIAVATALDRTVGHLFRPHGRHRAILGEGPVDVAINGGVDAGVHRQSGSTTQSVSGASANVSISRRTERTSLTIEDPITYTSGQSSAAQILIGYSTPSFGLTYGTVSSSQDSQIGVAGFARGLDLTLPRRRGTLDLLAASGTGSDGVGYHALGVRRTLPLSPRAQASLSLLHSVSNGGAEHATLADLALHRTGASSDTILEAAYGLASHVPGAAPGGRLAWSAQYDHSLPDTFYALYLRAIPDGFATIGSAQSGQLSFGANATRRFRQGGMLSLNIGRDRASAGDVQTTSFRQTYQYTQPLKFGSVSATVERSSADSEGASLRTTTYGVTASQSRGRTSFTETFQRAASAGNGDTVEAQSGFSVSRPILGGQGTLFLSTVHAGSAEGGTSVQNNVLGQYSRLVGRNATFMLTGNLEHALLNGDASRTLTLTTGIVRRISPSFSIEVDATHTRRTGAAGVASRANSIGVQLTG
ncbi:MAG: hypothetical protein JWO66_1487, partial [Candidatus Eremiobacteraeota bacterium]|nr:hypothetical protein [Candidatus Eremiobacteraeota bacterium]